jgi:phage shock protein PspC (stress-responsive transcriptional regulator)
MLFGVAGGMADWMDLDPSVVRLVWALLILAGGVGLLLYLIAAIVIPEAPFEASGASPAGTAAPGTAGAPTAGSDQTRWEAREARRAARRQNPGNAGMIFGLVLVIAGAWFLIDRYVPSLDTSWFIPGVLIVVGIVLVAGAMGRTRGPGAG